MAEQLVELVVLVVVVVGESGVFTVKTVPVYFAVIWADPAHTACARPLVVPSVVAIAVLPLDHTQLLVTSYCKPLL